jgi:hypothetical protein
MVRLFFGKQVVRMRDGSTLASFGISGTEPLGSTTRELVNMLKHV